MSDTAIPTSRNDCWDNTVVEHFFASLKTERVVRKPYRNREEERADELDYFEMFYDPRHPHSTLGYLGPADNEKQAILA